MNEDHLRELLHRSGNRLHVGPPPYADIVRSAKRRRGRALVAGTAALVAAIVLGSLGIAQVAFDAPSSADRGEDDVVADPQETEDGVVAVPALVGMQIKDVRKVLEAAGLRTRTLTPGSSACIPSGQVIDQEPAAGNQVPAGSRVTAFVNRHPGGTCGLNLPSVSDDLERVATLFLEFAEGERDSGPVDTPVEVYIGGELAKTIPSVRHPDRNEWQGCPGTAYAGRVCPISVLAPFVDYPGPIAFTSREPSHSCADPAELPETLAAYRTVTLTPDETRYCTDYFAVQLFVNDVGQVVAVNVVMSEP